MYDVELPDIAYYQRGIKCQAACPVRTDARAYIMAIAAGGDKRAYRFQFAGRAVGRTFFPSRSSTAKCGWIRANRSAVSDVWRFGARLRPRPSALPPSAST
jgi:hypothetical protein